MYDSGIAPVTGGARYWFSARGSVLEMKRSSMSGCGWGGSSEVLGEPESVLSGYRGPVVHTDDAVIEDSELCGNHIGIVLAATGIVLESTAIRDNTVHGVYLLQAENTTISHNTIEHGTVSSPFRIVESHGNLVLDNTILSHLPRGVIELFYSHHNTFRGNDLSGLGVGISVMFASNHNTILENTIATDETGVMIWGWNNRVEHLDRSRERQLLGRLYRHGRRRCRRHALCHRAGRRGFISVGIPGQHRRCRGPHPPWRKESRPPLRRLHRRSAAHRKPDPLPGMHHRSAGRTIDPSKCPPDYRWNQPVFRHQSGYRRNTYHRRLYHLPHGVRIRVSTAAHRRFDNADQRHDPFRLRTRTALLSHGKFVLTFVAGILIFRQARSGHNGALVHCVSWCEAILVGLAVRTSETATCSYCQAHV